MYTYFISYQMEAVDVNYSEINRTTVTTVKPLNSKENIKALEMVLQKRWGHYSVKVLGIHEVDFDGDEFVLEF